MCILDKNRMSNYYNSYYSYYHRLLLQSKRSQARVVTFHIFTLLFFFVDAHQKVKNYIYIVYNIYVSIIIAYYIKYNIFIL